MPIASKRTRIILRYKWHKYDLVYCKFTPNEVARALAFIRVVRCHIHRKEYRACGKSSQQSCPSAQPALQYKCLYIYIHSCKLVLNLFKFHSLSNTHTHTHLCACTHNKDINAKSLTWISLKRKSWQVMPFKFILTTVV